MADKIVNLYEDPSTQTPIPVRFVDQGDGTWALKGSGGAGGGGGAVTVADGADVTQGAQADAAWVSGNGTVIALLKNLAAKLAGSVAVTGTFWQATQPTKEVRAGTPAQSSVNVLLVSLSILAANANRLGATIYNEGPSACLTKLGATASATSYSISIASGGYYEVPFSYTGAIDGICAANNAQLRVTEVSL